MADARVNAVRSEAVPMAYYPIEQPATPGDLEVRSAVEAQSLIPELRKALLTAQPDLVIDGIIVLSDQVNSSLNPDRLIAGLSSAFGALALGLACFGLYGVMSYAVSRRKAELGVRIALGASEWHILTIILKESLFLVLSGLALGLILIFVLQRLLSAMLFGISAHDPATIVVAASILTIVAGSCACVPAWRASRVDPLVALRYE